MNAVTVEHTGLRHGLLVAILLIFASVPALAQRVSDQKDYSAAERLLFLDNHFARVKPPLTLRYRYTQSGTLEPGFSEPVVLSLTPSPDGSCCAAHTDYLSGTHRLVLPDLPGVEGNPVILHFLERDIAEMKRLTKGSQTHFRNRIRMAVYQSASVTPVVLRWKGADVQGSEVRISPYLDDPNRSRFERWVGKSYVFLFADAVPGGLYGIRTRVAADAADAAPLLVESLTIEGGDDTLPLKTEKR
ncbi:MAG: hypothetical protein ABIQ87_02270 [Rubrivivax sp.]